MKLKAMTFLFSTILLSQVNCFAMEENDFEVKLARRQYAGNSSIALELTYKGPKSFSGIWGTGPTESSMCIESTPTKCVLVGLEAKPLQPQKMSMPHQLIVQTSYTFYSSPNSKEHDPKHVIFKFDFNPKDYDPKTLERK